MERWEKINRILFTAMALIVIVFGAILTFDFSQTMWHRYGSKPSRRAQLPDNQTAREQARAGVRSHAISLGSFTAIDSAAGLYVVPVGFVRLEKPEDTASSVQFLRYQAASGHYYRTGARFSNLVVLDLARGTAKALFDERIGIANFWIFGAKVVALGTTEDTNGDGVFGGRDGLDLYAYDTAADQLQRLTNRALPIFDVRPLPLRDELLLTVGLDRDGDGLFEEGAEPKTLQRVDLNTYRIDAVIEPELVETLQTILDGA